MTNEEIRAKIAAVTIDLNEALAQIAAKHGLDKLERGRCTFTDNGFEMKLSAVFAGGDTKEMAKLRSHAFMYGLKEEVCGAVINYGTDHFELIGMKQTNMLLKKGGKQFVAPIDQVVAAIKRNHPNLVQ